jgi:hypothetical protein
MPLLGGGELANVQSPASIPIYFSAALPSYAHLANWLMGTG